MFCNVTYPNFEAIPEFARNDFTQQADGTWLMNQDAIQGAPAHFNAGLEANRNRALQQLKDANAARDAATARAQNAEAQLANLTQNGGRVFSAADAAAFDEYRKLGDVKTLQTTIATASQNAKELANLKGEKGVKDIAEKAGLQAQPISDWLARPETGVEYEPFIREVEREVEETQNGQTVKVKKPVPVAFLRKTVETNGVKTQTEVELLVEAKEKLPNYQYAAITAKTDESTPANQSNQTGGNETQTGNNVQTFALPTLGSQTNTQTGAINPQNQNLTPAQSFQAERDSKPSPFAPKK